MKHPQIGDIRVRFLIVSKAFDVTVIGMQEDNSIGTFLMDEWSVPEDTTAFNRKQRRSIELKRGKAPKLVQKARKSIDKFENNDLVLKLMYREKTHRGRLPRKQNGLKLRLLGKYSATQALGRLGLYKSSYFTETTSVIYVLSSFAVGCFLTSAV